MRGRSGRRACSVPKLCSALNESRHASYEGLIGAHRNDEIGVAKTVARASTAAARHKADLDPDERVYVLPSVAVPPVGYSRNGVPAFPFPMTAVRCARVP